MQNMSGGKSALGLDSNVVAGLCYVANICCLLGAVLAIITIVTDKANKLARFHAFQSLLVLGVLIVVSIVMNIVVFAIASTAGGGLALAVRGLVGIATLALWVIPAIQGFQGNIFKLPVIGDLADSWSN
jgi:uncharacterized membrane protein